MATIIPEKSHFGDFAGWLRDVECCATANGLSTEDKLQEMPAFLRGHAASYFHSLEPAHKDTYAHLTTALRTFFSPSVAQEQHYSKFEQRTLRPNEDPSLFLWDLGQILENADPTLTDEAKEALLSRQFMKGLPQAMRIHLLENNPNPTLTNMRDFVHRLYAVQPDQAHDLAAVCSPADRAENTSPHVQLLHSVDQLTATVASLQTSHQKLQAAVEAKDKQHEPLPRWRAQTGRVRRRRQDRCFNCNQVGHFAREYPRDVHCSLCHGWGHDQAQCANNSLHSWPAPRFNSRPQDPVPSLNFSVPANTVSHSSPNNSLNFEGVPQ